MYDEKRLVEQLGRGNHEAFRRLYEHYRMRIYFLLGRMLRSRDDVEEVFQTVFVRLWESRELLDPQQSFGGYLYTIARNCVYKHIGREISRQRLVMQIDGEIPAADGHLENLIAESDLENFLARLISRLPDRRREIFELHYRQHKTYREIGRLLGISENTVDTQIRRALNFLREQAGREFNAALPIIAFASLWLAG